MSQLDRIYKFDRMLRRKRPPAKREILRHLEISPAQFKRDLDFMRERFGAPITFDAELGGYRYSSGEFNLPGLWFSEPEVYSMLLMNALLEQLQPGLVREQLQPFEDKLRALLGDSTQGADSILDRMQVAAAPQRPVDPEHFRSICDGALRRKKLRMRYYARSRDEQNDRVVSPQHVIFYRGNWYLDAYCHEKKAGRRFAVDAIREVVVLDEPALNAPPSDSNQGYGIFAGPADHTAVLNFDSEAARWVRGEEWHPQQRVIELPKGGVQIEIPYGNSREILMDILRHGPHVEVVGPASLRSAVADAHRQAAQKYAPTELSVASAGTAVRPRPARARLDPRPIRPV